MKKAAEYIILPVLALGLLAGCAAGQRRDEIKKPEPTSEPVITTPSADDGMVKDNDGIITDDDTGAAPDHSAAPGRGTASPWASPSASPSASPASSPDGNG